MIYIKFLYKIFIYDKIYNKTIYTKPYTKK